MRRVGLRGTAWLGVLPYFAVVAIFLVLPVVVNVWSGLHYQQAFSFQNMAKAVQGQYLNSFANSIALSALTAVVGGALGLVLGWALAGPIRGPRWFREATHTFTTVASQSGGVALAFAFIAAVGTQGLLTRAMIHLVGWDISKTFPLTNFWGLALVYLYFQVPLMAILVLPAIEGLRKEWSEAAESLGASRIQYLRDVAAPIMSPAIAGALLLLFANAFAAYATAYALAGSAVNLVPIVLGFFLSGNVLFDTSFASAMATWMIIIVLVALGLRILLLNKSSKWQR